MSEFSNDQQSTDPQYEISEDAQRRKLLLALYTDMRLLVEGLASDPTPIDDVAETDSDTYEYELLDDDAKAEFLRKNHDTMLIDTFVHEGLRVGARRMDAKRVADGRDPLHTETLAVILASKKASQMYWEANATVLDHIEQRLPSSIKKTASLVAENLDAAFNNPVIFYESNGSNYRSRTGTTRYPFIDLGMQQFMQNNGWSPKLQALAEAVGMHQTAMYSAKQLVMSLLTDDKELIPDVKEGFESTFWERKVIGSRTTDGVQYYLGYILKSRALLKQHMQEMWGEDYEHNRQVFFATITMKTGGLPKKEKPVVREQRRSVYQTIAHNDFVSAKQGLVVIAQEHPQLFGRISREFLRQ